MIAVIILGVTIAIFAIIFALQNATTVVISLGAWQFEESLALILLTTVGIGITISLLLSLPTIIKRGWINSRQKRRIVDLETTISDREQELSKQSEYIQLLRENHQEVLHAFSLTDPATEFLNPQATLTLITYLLQQIRTRINNPHYSSLSVFVLSVEPAKSQHQVSATEWENSVNRAIARRLTQAINSNSFLGISEQKYYICLTLGLKGLEVGEYGEYLIQQLTESPLQKVDGTKMPLKVYLGGAIADPADEIDSLSLLKQAEENLAQAAEKKGNSTVITEIVTTLDSLPESN